MVALLDLWGEPQDCRTANNKRAPFQCDDFCCVVVTASLAVLQYRIVWVNFSTVKLWY